MRTPTPNKKTMWKWGEDGHLQAKERGLRKVNLKDTLILDVYPSKLSTEKYPCCLNYSVCSTSLLKTLSNEYYKDTHHRILIAAQDKNISVQQWRHCSFIRQFTCMSQEEIFHMVSFFFFFAKFWF